MSSAPPGIDAPARPPEETTGLGRFGLRSLFGWGALLVGAVPFLLLWLLVERTWPPLARIDQGVAAGLNDAVDDWPAAVTVLSAVTDLGGTEFAVLFFVLLVAFLLIRGQRRLAAFATVTGVGLAVLGPLTKAVVDRARPVVESPVVELPSNASYPSGHSMTALITWGTLLVVALPAVRRRARPWLIAGAAILVLAVGFTRLALGVHFVSDVLAGWALAAGWLAVTAAAFRGWQHDRGEHPDEPYDPLDLPPASAPHLTDEAEPVRGDRRRTAVALAAVAAVLSLGLTALGLLIVEGAPQDTWLGRIDHAIVDFFLGVRTDTWSDVADAIGRLSGTPAVIAVGLGTAVLSVAWTRRLTPAVFVVVAVVGEVLLYVAVSQTVGRLRPDVQDLTSGLPGGASWPSGHVAAAVAVYGAAATLLVLHRRGKARWWWMPVPVLIALSVGVSRIYVAAHYPSDVLAGLILGGVWVLACAHLVLRPPADRRTARSLAGWPAGGGVS
jgi:membrane-associated phospholipid phosphatase